jgi:DICT domain-containing protein
MRETRERWKNEAFSVEWKLHVNAQQSAALGLCKEKQRNFKKNAGSVFE